MPFADVGPFKIGPDLPDEKVLFLSDIFPTGYMAAENAEIEPGDTVAVWGCGPVGAVRDPERLDARRRPRHRHRPRARTAADGRSSTARPRRSTSKDKVYDRLQEMTSGRGPDRCIDAVGCEAHGSGSFDAVMDKVKTAVDARHGPAARAARSDHVLPQGRHDLGSRRLRRVPGQDPVRRLDEQGPDDQDGPDAHAALHEAAAGEDRERARSIRRSSSRIACRSKRPRSVQDVPRQEGRLHQGGAQAIADCTIGDGTGPAVGSGNSDAPAVRRGSPGHRRHARRTATGRMRPHGRTRSRRSLHHPPEQVRPLIGEGSATASCCGSRPRWTTNRARARRFPKRAPGYSGTVTCRPSSPRPAQPRSSSGCWQAA